MLAPEVVVVGARVAPEGFDARFAATFTGRFAWHHPGRLTLGAMRRAALELEGRHDFRSFCRHPEDGRSTTRDLRRLTVARTGDRISVRAVADAFLHQMVRSLVGTLVAVGEGKLEPTAMHEVLAARDRAAAVGGLAPARGLTLERVRYR